MVKFKVCEFSGNVNQLREDKKYIMDYMEKVSVNWY